MSSQTVSKTVNSGQNAVTTANQDYEVYNPTLLGACHDVTKLDPFTLSSGFGFSAVAVINPSTNNLFEYVAYSPNSYSDYSNSTKRIYTSSSYSEAFSDKFKASGSYGTASFKAKAKYNEENSETTTHDQSMTYTEYLVTLYNLQFDAFSDSIELITEFSDAVKDLPSTYDANNPDDFLNFINTYGTHFSSMVTMGGRSYQTLTIVNDSYSSMTSQSIDISVSAQGTYEGATGSMSNDATSSETSTFKSEVSSSTNEVQYAPAGGTTMTGADLMDWKDNTVPYDPVATYINLEKHSVLLTAGNFPDLADIEKRADALDAAIEDYLSSQDEENRGELLEYGDDFKLQFTAQSNEVLGLYNTDVSNFENGQEVTNFHTVLEGLNYDKPSQSWKLEKVEAGDKDKDDNFVRVGDKVRLVDLETKAYFANAGSIAFTPDDPGYEQYLNDGQLDFFIGLATDPQFQDGDAVGSLIGDNMYICLGIPQNGVMTDNCALCGGITVCAPFIPYTDNCLGNLATIRISNLNKATS